MTRRPGSCTRRSNHSCAGWSAGVCRVMRGTGSTRPTSFNPREPACWTDCATPAGNSPTRPTCEHSLPASFCAGSTTGPGPRLSRLGVRNLWSRAATTDRGRNHDRASTPAPPRPGNASFPFALSNTGRSFTCGAKATHVKRSPTRLECTPGVCAGCSANWPGGLPSMSIDVPTSRNSTEVYALADQLAIEMRRRWDAGDRVVTEEFVKVHPTLRDHPGAVGELIYEEVTLRREHGETDGSSEILRRFPQWAAQLRVMLELREALEADNAAAFPEVGEPLGEFHLLAEIGRGSRGRVYLARQPALADRPVVVKVSSRADSEHLSLARLQHTHIVPHYTVSDEPARGLRALCMPFFGGTTLAHSLEQVAPIPPADRKPTDLWDIVATGPGTNILGTSLALPPRWAATDYTALIAHLAVCLADALQFAHDRGLVHMDVKPSNILLTADGQPMLLDFHLARPPVSVNDPPPARLGGTPVYCAPEQGAALGAVRAGQQVRVAVDRRADVYALGVVLYEALAGQLPNPGVPVFHHNSRVSVGLSDIVTRCLAPNPANRYAEAAALAADLRYHLAALPLRGVRNRSFAERWRKWRRRRPHMLGIITGLAMGLVAIGVAAGHIRHRRGMAQIALEEGSYELDRGRVAEARGAFRRGLAAAEGLPVGIDLEAALASGLRRADRAAVAADLHAVAEGMRALSVADTIPRGDRDAANRLGRQLWDRRDELFALAATDLRSEERRVG